MGRAFFTASPYTFYNQYPQSIQNISLFIPEDPYSTISANTNIYVIQKGAGRTSLMADHCMIQTANKSKIFNAIVLYMGVHKSRNFKNYWSSTWKPRHLPPDYMIRYRFEQIKRYLHISNPMCPNINTFEPSEPADEATAGGLYLGRIWRNKIKALASRFRRACTTYYTPSSTVSIDKSMVVVMGARSIPTRCQGSQQFNQFKFEGHIWTELMLAMRNWTKLNWLNWTE